MSYIYGDLKSKLAVQIGDPNLADSVTSDALNYTQQSIFNTFDLTLNSAQTTRTVTAGTNVLSSALPTDFQKVSSLYIASPIGQANDITNYFVSPKDFRMQFPQPSLYSGVLQYWTLWSSIEFSNNAAENYTLSIDYTKSVPIMSTSTDVPVIPESFEELLILGAKIRIYEQKEDFDYAAQFTNRYADLIEAFTQRYSMRQVDIQANVPGARTRV
jgi:hypothetical protein